MSKFNELYEALMNEGKNNMKDLIKTITSLIKQNQDFTFTASNLYEILGPEGFSKSDISKAFDNINNKARK